MSPIGTKAKSTDVCSPCRLSGANRKCFERDQSVAVDLSGRLPWDVGDGRFRCGVAVSVLFAQRASSMGDDLQVEISPPKSRGMKLRFSSGSQQFEQDFTTSVYPFLEQLCDAIRVLHYGFIDEKIRLLIGAPECDLCLQAAAGSSQA